MKSPGSLSTSNSPALAIAKSGGSSNRKRIRMSRCGQCVGCHATNCEKCYKCLDMIKYGGPGTLKQACERRQCINPQMPGVAPLFTSPQYSSKGINNNRYLTGYKTVIQRCNNYLNRPKSNGIYFYFSDI